MNIRRDEIDKIAIDRFPSASGQWISILCERYEPVLGGLRAFYIAIVVAGTLRVRKVVRIATEPTSAFFAWEDWKQKFGQMSGETYENDIPTALTELKLSLPIINEEDTEVLKMIPVGSRIYVRDITPQDEITVRAQEAGLHVIIDEAHKPRPTMGIVVAIGEDPYVQELYKVGMILMFSKHAGDTFMESGQQYRILEPHEIKGKRRPEDGIQDLLPSSEPSRS